MIDTVIFDIGNVLMDFDNVNYMWNLLGDEETVRHVDAAIWLSGYWDELDRGVDPEEVFSWMTDRDPEYQNEIRRTLEHVEQCMGRKEYAISWIRELKERGLRVLYLSNYSRFCMDLKPEVLDFLPYMDGGVFSCEVKSIKPEEEIYRIMGKTYQLDPDRCVFLDDREANIATAEKMGWNTIRFESYEQAREALEKMITEQ